MAISMRGAACYRFLSTLAVIRQPSAERPPMALAIFWFLFALAAILPVRFVVYLFFAGLAFGSFNTIPGGFNLTPYAATAPLLAARLLGGRGAGARLGDALLNPLRFGLSPPQPRRCLPG